MVHSWIPWFICCSNNTIWDRIIVNNRSYQLWKRYLTSFTTWMKGNQEWSISYTGTFFFCLIIFWRLLDVYPENLLLLKCFRWVISTKKKIYCHKIVSMIYVFSNISPMFYFYTPWEHQFSADSAILTEEILNEEIYFLYSISCALSTVKRVMTKQYFIKYLDGIFTLAINFDNTFMYVLCNHCSAVSVVLLAVVGSIEKC